MSPVLLPAALGCASLAPAAQAQEGPDFAVAHTMDVVAVAGEGEDKAFWLDNLDLTADAPLTGTTRAHGYVLVNLGGMPNDRAGTLQGVNNIEVASHRVRLFEAWIEQQLDARSTLRAGLYDLNSEFYSNDSAGLLIAPAFGVGSEIAATGPNGPSIFPSTALGVRLDRSFAGGGFARVAVLNASARTFGDPGGVDLDFHNGALVIGEAGAAGKHGKIGVGAWAYTRRQDDLAAVDAAGDPLRRRAHGAYVIAERPFGDPEGQGALSAFVRAGISDGKTTPFRGGWQAGMLVTRLWAGRDDSQFSLGVNQGYVSHGYREVLRGEGVRTAAAESAVELTYSDKLAKWLTLQPDLQLIFDAGGDADARPVLVAGLRSTMEF
ncbi:MAG: carbohydrate porin [Sphingomonas sp.]|uniref:carbohydrate porin n=1 Tax=Sphingomonas sp. TaxID=28214 RepID=UPI001B2CFCCB|nr:carbohydrate porin [Sphingomonas sp.]MBO9623653.1 carbohydrate porin [Sphingomonas sp.]